MRTIIIDLTDAYADIDAELSQPTHIGLCVIGLLYLIPVATRVVHKRASAALLAPMILTITTLGLTFLFAVSLTKSDMVEGAATAAIEKQLHGTWEPAYPEDYRIPWDQAPEYHDEVGTINGEVCFWQYMDKNIQLLCAPAK